MNGGDKEGLKAVPSHQAGKVLTAKYLNEIETAIKARTPIKGTNIDIFYLDGGSVISVTGGLAAVGDPVVLTVCSNGTPTVVTVVGYSG
jgi:hypothetical protein